VDCNGVIDFLEFCFISHVLEDGGSLQDKMEMIFRMFDQDSNGYLTKDEVFLSLAKVGLHDFALVDEIYKRCDKDHNEKISCEEWVQEMLANKETRALVDPETKKELQEQNKNSVPEDGFAVKTLTGKTITVAGLKDGDSISLVKEKIQTGLGIPIKTQRLIFAGQELSNNQTILSAKVPFKSIIQVVVDVR